MPKIYIHENFNAQFCGQFSETIEVDPSNFNHTSFDCLEDISLGDILDVFEETMRLPFDHNCSITIHVDEATPAEREALTNRAANLKHRKGVVI